MDKLAVLIPAKQCLILQDKVDYSGEDYFDTKAFFFSPLLIPPAQIFSHHTYYVCRYHEYSVLSFH